MNTATAENKIKYTVNAQNFSKIPGSPIAYWVSRNIYRVFTLKSIYDIEPPRFGMSTSDNNRFVRCWFEIKKEKFAIPQKKLRDVNYDKKWFPFNNGGEYRRWYGNNQDVVNWKNDGAEIKAFGRAAIRNKDFYYKEGITWTAISSSKISVRSFDCGFLFSSAGFCIFLIENKEYLLAFMNSIVANSILKILSPTLNYNVGDIAKLPIKIQNEEVVKLIAKSNIEISKSDWDSFEISWDFKKHPLM